jgi:hypothetical protein
VSLSRVGRQSVDGLTLGASEEVLDEWTRVLPIPEANTFVRRIASEVNDKTGENEASDQQDLDQREPELSVGSEGRLAGYSTTADNVLTSLSPNQRAPKKLIPAQRTINIVR